MLRGFAMVCVIFGHPKYVPSDIEMWIYSFHMPLFFMISGSLFRYEKYDSLRSCLADQAKKLLVPYTCLYLICTPLWYVNRKVLGSNAHSVIDVLVGGLYTNQDLAVQSNGALWFLPALFLTISGYWLICDLQAKGKANLAGVIGACFLAGTLSSYFMRVPMPWHISALPMTIVFFHAGNALLIISFLDSKNDELINGLSPSAASLLIVCLLAVGTAAAFANGKISVHANSYKDIALALVSIFALSIGLALLFMHLPKMKALSYIGANSIVFLAFHVPVLRFLENLPATSAFAERSPLWIALITVVVLFPICAFVVRFLPFAVGKSTWSRGRS